ncbi:hypothetical protein [Roseateles sp. L2-2]|uniref:hypothetical protein n=1 Tax=Roseateles TaxID=93681 RepID=UPI003D36A72C
MTTSSPQTSVVPMHASNETRYESTQRIVQLAVELKAKFKSLTYQSIGLKDRLAHIESALVDDRPPLRVEMRRLYSSIGIELPDAALRRFEEVEIFHDSVLANRRIHLVPEIEQIKAQVDELDRQAAQVDQLRSDLLRQLDERL